MKRLCLRYTFVPHDSHDFHPVDDSIADAFRAASVKRQRQLQILLRLRELTIHPQRSLDDILDQVGRAAESKGLTPKLLDSMLGDS